MPASTRAAESRKLPSTAWRPGQSGNPRGRAPAPIDIAALARQHGPKCIEVVAQLLHDKDKKLRLAAAQTLLDRGFGRPPTHITTDGEVSITMLHLIAARTIASTLPMLDAKPEPVDTNALQHDEQPDE